MPTNFPGSLDTTTQLPTNRADGTALATNHAADHDNADAAIVAVETKVGSGASVPTNIGDVLTVTAAGATSFAPAASGTYQTELFGILDRTSIPFADAMTLKAIARGYDMPASVTSYQEASATEITAAQAAITGAAANGTVQLLRRIYRTTFTGPVNTGVIVKGPASIRGSDDWSTGGLAGNTWSTAASPNATNGIVSSLSIGSPLSAETSGAPLIGGGTTVVYGTVTTSYLATNREMVIVDGVPYNRQSANATLSAGQWCLDIDTTATRHVIIYLAGGAGSHKIEVVTRLQWATTLAINTTWQGIDFRHSSSANNQWFPLENSSVAGLNVVNCMLGMCHGTVIAVGGATGIQIVGTVFHNSGVAAVQGNAAVGAFLRGNVTFNCGGTQSNYNNLLDTSGYDWTWGSGGFKVSGSDSTVEDGNFAFNMGFTSYWSDVICRYDNITNNVVWDFRGYGILYEVSAYGRIAGNVVFQTNSSQFYAGLNALIGIYSSTARGMEVGGDNNAGILQGNLIMRMPVGFKGYWQHSRIGVAAVQTMTATATAGTLTFTFLGVSTTAAWNATAATIQTALQGLSTVGSSSITCTGGPSGTSAVVMTFAGRLAAGPQPLITVSASSGVTPTISTTTTGTGDAPLGGLTDLNFHGNIIVARKSGVGLTTSDVMWQWTDDVTGADIPAATTAARGPVGWSNAYGWEAAVEDVVNHNISNPVDFLWYSASASNQDASSGYWQTIGAVGASRWENGQTQGQSVGLTGTVAKAGSTALTGTGTFFTLELGVGSIVMVPGTANEFRAITAITSDTAATVDIAFVNTASAQVCHRLMPVGQETRWLTLAEQALYLGRYGLTLRN